MKTALRWPARIVVLLSIAWLALFQVVLLSILYEGPIQRYEDGTQTITAIVRARDGAVLRAMYGGFEPTGPVEVTFLPEPSLVVLPLVALPFCLIACLAVVGVWRVTAAPQIAGDSPE